MYWILEMPSILEVKINILDSPATPVTTEQTKDPIFLIYQLVSVFTLPNTPTTPAPKKSKTNPNCANMYH